MSLKKLSLAAALSIGILTINGIANAACPVCPQQQMVPQEASCPVQQTLCPKCQHNPCSCVQAPMVPGCSSISGNCANCNSDAKIFKRQAFAFPTLGNSSIVIPKGSGIVQIGGSEESIAVGNSWNSGLTTAPEMGGALSLYPKHGPYPNTITGAACPVTQACPTQIMQGSDIGRCCLPAPTGSLQSLIKSVDCSGQSATTGGATAIPVQAPGMPPCAPPCIAPIPAPCTAPCPAPCPVPCNPCDPCKSGAALPDSNSDLVSSSKIAGHEILVADICPTACPVPCAPASVALPVQIAPQPIQAFCDPRPCDALSIPTGAAAPVGGCPVTLETPSGIQFQKTIMVPVQPAPCAPTGSACPVDNQYPDVSNNMSSGCDINTLTCHGVLAGYPDRTYKPALPILRSELSSAMVAGLQLQNVPASGGSSFSDVRSSFWAHPNIEKSLSRGVMIGYPSDKFKPKRAATRAEALTAMSKAIPDAPCDPQSVLSSYVDANEIPSWATLPVAKALNAGLTCCLPDSTHIKPNESPSRAEVATMLRTLRQKLCLEPSGPTLAMAAAPTGCASELQPQVVTQTIPVLKVKMQDMVTARTSLINDRFVAKTTEPITINGQTFPCGSDVRGRVVEVIRPGFGKPGGIRLAFDKIGSGSCNAQLPKDILSATVIKEKNPNIIGRVLEVPFTGTGKIVGITGRTVGGTVTIAGNALEGFFNNVGNGTNELFNAKPMAAGRSYLSSGREVVVGTFDIAKTVVTGAAGIVKETGDELAYVISPDGSRIAQINPNENLSIAFGCK